MSLRQCRRLRCTYLESMRLLSFCGLTFLPCRHPTPMPLAHSIDDGITMLRSTVVPGNGCQENSGQPFTFNEMETLYYCIAVHSSKVYTYRLRRKLSCLLVFSSEVIKGTFNGLTFSLIFILLLPLKSPGAPDSTHPQWLSQWTRESSMCLTRLVPTIPPPGFATVRLICRCSGHGSFGIIRKVKRKTDGKVCRTDLA